MNEKICPKCKNKDWRATFTDFGNIENFYCTKCCYIEVFENE